MVCTAACNDINFIDIFNIFFCKRNIVKNDFAVLNSRTDGISDSFWLFFDFFHHKVFIAAFFSRTYVPINRKLFFFNFFFICIVNLYAVLFKYNDFVIFKVVNISCVL